jgi:hypothetical protein
MHLGIPKHSYAKHVPVYVLFSIELCIMYTMLA